MEAAAFKSHLRFTVRTDWIYVASISSFIQLASIILILPEQNLHSFLILGTILDWISNPEGCRALHPSLSDSGTAAYQPCRHHKHGCDGTGRYVCLKGLLELRSANLVLRLMACCLGWLNPFACCSYTLTGLFWLHPGIWHTNTSAHIPTRINFHKLTRMQKPYRLHVCPSSCKHPQTLQYLENIPSFASFRTRSWCPVDGRFFPLHGSGSNSKPSMCMSTESSSERQPACKAGPAEWAASFVINISLSAVSRLRG